MAWIQSHQEIRNHPKTGRLARALGVNRPAAIGHLHLLWYWALDYAEDGDLSGFDPGEIAEAMMWDGDPDQLLDALVSAGFVDRKDGALEIHDWDDYAGRLIDGRDRYREANRERQRRFRERKKAEQEDDNVTVTLRNGPRVEKSKEEKNRERKVPANAEAATLTLSDTTNLPKLPLPENFAPDPTQWRAIQEELRITDAFLRKETTKFRDRCKDVGTVSADWQAAWRNWIRRGFDHHKDKGEIRSIQLDAKPVASRPRREGEGNPLLDVIERAQQEAQHGS